jgi:hypothetical protein
MKLSTRFCVPAFLAVLMVAFVLQPVVAATGSLDQQQTSILGGLLLYSSPPESSFQFLSQTFTAGLTGTLTEVDLAVGCEGDCTSSGPVTVEIHSASPTGTLLGSSSLGPSDIPIYFGSAPTDFVTFTFSGVSLVAGSVYAIVITASNAQYDIPHYVVADYYLSDSYAAGTAYYNDGSGWLDLNYDLAFKTYVAVPCYDIEQNGVPVNTLNIPVGNTFSVDIWIRNIPSNGLQSFYFVVSWNQTMMELESYQRAPNPNWETWNVGTYGWYIDFYGWTSNDYITNDMIYLTLTFRCLSQGSSQVRIHDGYLHIDGQENILPPDFDVTCNQYKSNPVGGINAPTEKLTILTPYIALVGLIGTISSIFAIRRWCKD